MNNVLVHLGCYNKCHRLGSLKTTKIYISQSWNLKVQGQSPALLGEGPLLGHRHLALCHHMANKGKGSSRVSFVKALIPFKTSPPSWPKHFPEAPPPNTIALDIRTSTYDFGMGDGTQSDHSKQTKVFTVREFTLEKISKQTICPNMWDYVKTCDTIDQRYIFRY